VSKRFFLKKEAKTFARLSPGSPRQPRKSVLVPFFKTELFLLPFAPIKRTPERMKYLAALLLLSGTAQAADYGAFLTSQFATSQGRLDIAASQILTALAADPGSIELQKDAFALAVLAGRPDAAALAAELPQNPLAQLVMADAQVTSGHWPAAELAFAELPHDSMLGVLQPVLLAWSQQAQGLTDKALDTLQQGMSGEHMTAFYKLHAALIADVAHRDGLADRLYSQVAADMDQPNVRLAQILASWQARNGHKDKARALIESLVRSLPELAISRESLLASIAAPQIADPASGIAEAYAGMAGALRQEKQSGEVPPMMLQLALRLQPQLTEANLLAAELAGTDKRWLLAADALGRISATDPLAAVVALHRATYLARAGKTEEAQSILERLIAAHPDRPEPQSDLGDLFVGQKKFGDAILAYTRAIELTPSPLRTDWPLFYARGAAYQRAHDWPRAEADMKQALRLDPNQAIVLNFLGFSYAEQNRNLTEAHDMIQRALDQRPNDGEIVDSLGWVVLRQGDVKQAVRLLERAAELDPSDPTITGHLGDAYWDAGRHIEAADQWRRALVLNPEPEDAVRIEARLKSAGN
jgi:tetratricopeptide (TPR) repeat protein